MSEESRRERPVEFWPDNQSQSRFQRVQRPEKTRRPGRLLTVFKALILLAAMAVTAYGALDSGSYGDIRWLPITIGALLAVVVTLFVRGFYADVPSVGWLLVAALAVLAGMKGLSMTWTLSEGDTIKEVIRASTYLSFFLVVLAALSFGRQVGPMMDIAVLIIVAIAGYGLLQKIYPVEYPVLSLDGVRMDSTLGYSNSTAIMIAMGILLALSRMTQSSGVILRSVYSSLSLAFVAALYLTVSRGGIGALLIALALLFIVSERRLQMFVNLLTFSAPAAWLLWRMQGLEGLLGAQSEEALRVADGLALRDDLIAATVASFVLQAIYALVVRRYELMPLGRRVLGIAILGAGALLALVGVVVAVVRYGGPASLYRSLAENPMLTEDGASRLVSLSIGNRLDYWSVAWEYWTAHPLTGSGAGTFSYVWLQNRPINTGVQQVHNLYLEQGVETGVFAFLALLAFVVVLVGYSARAAWKSSGHRRVLLSGLLAASVAYLVSSLIEWHWYIPPSTLFFFIIAAITVKFAARPDWLAPEPEMEPEAESESAPNPGSGARANPEAT